MNYPQIFADYTENDLTINQKARRYYFPFVRLVPFGGFIS